MNTNVSDDEIDALIKESNLSPTPLAETQPIKEESLEKLLEEIMSSAPTAPPASALSEERTPLFTLKGEKKKRMRFPLVPIWLSIAVMGAFLVGGALGFYWGKSDPSAPTLKAIEKQMNLMTEQVDRLVKAMEPPSTSPQEIIQPLEEQNRSSTKKLAKEAIL